MALCGGLTRKVVGRAIVGRSSQCYNQISAKDFVYLQHDLTSYGLKQKNFSFFSAEYLAYNA
jgi:hypothetical protein